MYIEAPGPLIGAAVTVVPSAAVSLTVGMPALRRGDTLKTGGMNYLPDGPLKFTVHVNNPGAAVFSDLRLRLSFLVHRITFGTPIRGSVNPERIQLVHPSVPTPLTATIAIIGPRGAATVTLGREHMARFGTGTFELVVGSTAIAYPVTIEEPSNLVVK